MKYIKAVLITLVFIFVCTFTGYNPPENKALVGCALSNCPQAIQDYHFKNGGVRYYADYPRDSKEYWHAYCTDFPDKCINI